MLRLPLIVSMGMLLTSQVLALNVINNCDHDVYVATYNGIRSDVAGGSLAVHTDGWYRITRFQSKSFNTNTVRIVTGGSVLTDRDEQNQLVSYGCATDDGKFAYRIWHTGVQGAFRDPAKECLYDQKGRWLAFQYISGREVIVEGLNCAPAAYIHHNHFAAYDRDNRVVRILKSRGPNSGSWRLLTPSGSTPLAVGLGTDDATWEFMAEGNGTYKGKWFRITEGGSEIEWSSNRRNWDRFAIKGGWQKN